ncbi:thiamine pyrophosphate-binding protein [Alkalihalobacillus oceani]|uniref:thiamine pyrophosphate-binding protein n=1 Tax=Halalkalibacter oceani TaxID=1653776 RepID=UPI00203F7973|nr:thiamine pyrophosphate-binding protein [Halalkalibacter oceani]MCM3763253.1 thiamine pyrophosphate-binding protein [Halalkalibacter oceani]
MKKGKVAEFVTDFLVKEGVKCVYGIPGGQPLTILDAIYDRDDIDFVATRHENGAAHAADAVGRLTGVPGVCLATTGPGATNLITGVGGAFQDSSPVIVITANNNRKDMLHDDAQNADHKALFDSLVKWSVLISHPEHVESLLNEAFNIALSGNPGPVHVDFTRDVLSEVITWEENKSPHRSANRILGDEEGLQELKERLILSERPVFWVGNGAKISGAGEEILKLAEQLAIPVITTFNGITAVDMSHEQVFGPLSRSGSMLAADIIAEADTLIAIGNSLNGPSTGRWTMKIPNEIYQIDIDPTMLGRHYPGTKGVWGDVKVCITYLLDQLVEVSASNHQKEWLEICQEKRTFWKEKYITPYLDNPTSPIYPQTVVQALSEVAKSNAIFSVDAGNPGIWTHIMPLKKGQFYMKPVGFGNMAFALPAAIAAKLEQPNREVVCLVGDGGLGMSLGELETAVRTNANIIVVCMNDRAYGNIKQEQIRDFGPTKRHIGVDFVDWDFATVAKAVNGDGERVTNVEDFKAAYKRAQDANKLYLIDVQIDPDTSVWTKPF